MRMNRYSRYVVVNEDTGSVCWYENSETASKEKDKHGGTLYDLDTDNQITIEHALHSARHRMGVE